MIANRIKYCTDVNNNVLIYHGDEDIINPKDVLDELINELKDIENKIVAESITNDFKDNLKRLNVNITTLISGTFDLLYQSLNGSYNKNFLVAEFMESSIASERNKNDLLKGTTFGAWLQQTCMYLGLKGNSYCTEQNIEALSLTQYMHNISTGFSVQTPHITKQRMGVHQFMLGDSTAPAFHNKVSALVKQTVSLHRSILGLYFLQKTIIDACLASSSLGENWLFRTQEGAAIIEALAAVVIDITKEHKERIDNYWKNVYTTHFKSYTQNNKLDNKHPMHRSMTNALNSYDKSTKALNKMTEIINEVRAYVVRAVQQGDLTLEYKRSLASSMHNYLSQPEKYDNNKLEQLTAIKNSYSEQTAAHMLDTFSDEARNKTQLYLETYNLDQKTASSNLIVLLCQSFSATDPVQQAQLTKAAHDLTLKEAEKKRGCFERPEFVSLIVALDQNINSVQGVYAFVGLSRLKNQHNKLQDFHLQIYEQILKPYEVVVNRNYFIALFFGYTFSAMDSLRHHYQRLTHALLMIVEQNGALYKPQATDELYLVNQYLLTLLNSLLKEHNSIRGYLSELITDQILAPEQIYLPHIKKTNELEYIFSEKIKTKQISEQRTQQLATDNAQPAAVQAQRSTNSTTFFVAATADSNQAVTSTTTHLNNTGM